jgi:protein gp37
MADRSKIEWTDASWNPIRARHTTNGHVGWHCEHATTGCAGCYAEAFNKRLGTGLPFKPGHLDAGDVELFLDQRMLLQPLRWKKPRHVFVCSMTDLFGRFVSDDWLDKIFAVMALCPQHTFQVLTKRSDRMREYFVGKERFRNIHPLEDRHYAINEAMEAIAPADWCKRELDDHGGLPLPNVWLGVSAERQQEYDERKEHLRQTPAAVRFFSMEPLLGKIIADYLADWVIAGGESGKDARPMHPDWARGLRDQCQAAGVAFFFKQWGEWAPNIGAVDGWAISDNPEISKYPHREWEDGRWSDDFYPMWCDFSDGNYDESQCVSRVGKRAAGRLLDGVEHNAFPERPAA